MRMNNYSLEQKQEIVRMIIYYIWQHLNIEDISLMGNVMVLGLNNNQMGIMRVNSKMTKEMVEEKQIILNLVSLLFFQNLKMIISMVFNNKLLMVNLRLKVFIIIKK